MSRMLAAIILVGLVGPDPAFSKPRRVLKFDLLRSRPVKQFSEHIQLSVRLTNVSRRPLFLAPGLVLKSFTYQDDDPDSDEAGGAQGRVAGSSHGTPGPCPAPESSVGILPGQSVLKLLDLQGLGSKGRFHVTASLVVVVSFDPMRCEAWEELTGDVSGELTVQK